MEHSKSPFLSKGVWGGVIALVATAFSFFFGIEVTGGEQTVLLESILQIVAAGGSILAIIGRLVANSRLV
ncbi:MULTISPECIES: hypothetical protein [unclassified Roseibium]|uniref:hypothetical protein n=1 Tax=unclassified Roseibium TaxID=2629323 RepID=UPI00273D0CC4|nr:MULTISPECIES: hypothetical protein [unclassified Roseibium]